MIGEAKSLGDMLAAIPVMLSQMTQHRRADDRGWRTPARKIAIGISITVGTMILVAIGSSYMTVMYATPTQISSIGKDMDNLGRQVKDLSETTIKAIDKIDNRMNQLEARQYEHRIEHSRRQK